MSSTTVTSLRRGLEILRLLNQEGYREVRTLHDATGLPKPTIVRMLDTLIAAGYVIRNDVGRYLVTAKVLSLANGYQATEYLLRVAEPAMEQFRSRHGWPSDLAVFDYDAMVIVNTGRRPGTLSSNRNVGSRLPVTVTSLGRAHLAFCSPAERERIIQRLNDSRDPTEQLAKDPKAVEELIRRVRRQGYATSDREYLTNTRAVAVPIMIGDKVMGCINTMVLAEVMPLKQAARTFSEPLRVLAGEIAEGLQNQQLP